MFFFFQTIFFILHSDDSRERTEWVKNNAQDADERKQLKGVGAPGLALHYSLNILCTVVEVTFAQVY